VGGFFIECAFYIFCLLWKPAVETLVIVSILFIVRGVLDSTWKCTTNGKKIANKYTYCIYFTISNFSQVLLNMKTSLHKDTYCNISQNKKRECVRFRDKNEHQQNFEKNELIGNNGKRKTGVLNSLIINITAKANDTTDILQTFR